MLIPTASSQPQYSHVVPSQHNPTVWFPQAVPEGEGKYKASFIFQIRHYHCGKRDFQDIVSEEEWQRTAGQSDSAVQEHWEELWVGILPGQISMRSASAGLRQYLLSWWPWRSSHTRTSWGSLGKEKKIFSYYHQQGLYFCALKPNTSYKFKGESQSNIPRDS